MEFGEVYNEFAAQNTFGRPETIDEVVWALLMLLEPQAELLHGGVIHLDGGGLRGIT